MALNIVEGQTAPVVYRLLADGGTYSLSGCTVAIEAMTQAGADVAWTGVLTVSDAANGEVSFAPAAGDFLATANKYLVRFAVTRSDSKIEYFPSGNREVWTVRK